MFWSKRRYVHFYIVSRMRRESSSVLGKSFATRPFCALGNATADFLIEQKLFFSTSVILDIIAHQWVHYRWSAYHIVSQTSNSSIFINSKILLRNSSLFNSLHQPRGDAAAATILFCICEWIALFLLVGMMHKSLKCFFLLVFLLVWARPLWTPQKTAFGKVDKFFYLELRHQTHSGIKRLNARHFVTPAAYVWQCQCGFF